MKIEETEREFIIKINDTERKKLIENLDPHKGMNVIDDFCRLLEGMDIL